MKNLCKIKLLLFFALISAGYCYSQTPPVIQVPLGCNVLVAGSGVGAVTGFGGKVGDGGIVAMPDPFDFSGTAGNFTFISNGTTLVNFKIEGDLSYQTSNVAPAAAVQGVNTAATVNIESYNKVVRNASEGTAPSTPTLARSKGRVTIKYAAPCSSSFYSFEIYKTYSNASYLPPIIGPSCIEPSKTYTYSVDQIASDNASASIGFDNYFWSGIPSTFTNVYRSADESSITFTTPINLPSTLPPLTCSFGICNTATGAIGAAQTTFVTKTLLLQPTAPVFTGPVPTCLATGITSFNVSFTPVAGYSYVWSYGGGSWTVTPSGAQNQNLAVTTVDNSPGTLTLTVNNQNSCIPSVFTYVVNRNYVAPSTTIFAYNGSNCWAAGQSVVYNVNGAQYSNTTWDLPFGWTYTNANGTGSSINLNIPITAAAGAYIIGARSTNCPSSIVTTTVNIRPTTPTIVGGGTCVPRNSGTSVNYNCSTVAGALYYIWSIPAGWTVAGGTTTTTVPNINLIPGGTAVGPVAITVVAAVTPTVAGSFCNGLNSAAYLVNYAPITPTIDPISCWNTGLPASKTIQITNFQNFGNYEVVANSSLFTGGSILSTTASIAGSISSTGLITLSNALFLNAGTYSLQIKHKNAPCTDAVATITITVSGAVSTPLSVVNYTGTSNGGSCDNYSFTLNPLDTFQAWVVNGIQLVNPAPFGAQYGITGNQLTMCSSNAPSSVCIKIISTTNTCPVRICSATLGTRGASRQAAANNSSNSFLNNNINIYPNPNNGAFIIRLENLKGDAIAKITDIAGKNVGAYLLKKGDNKIQDETLTAGVYTVTISIDGKIEARQIIVK